MNFGQTFHFLFGMDVFLLSVVVKQKQHMKESEENNLSDLI
ncbi:hypothetical protein X975_12777, partial [Stegodyphus mimosarum]